MQAFLPVVTDAWRVKRSQDWLTVRSRKILAEWAAETRSRKIGASRRLPQIHCHLVAQCVEELFWGCPGASAPGRSLLTLTVMYAT